jgi:hypothetical protein
MDKIRDFPDGPRTAMILALFPLAWKPDARHRSLTGTSGARIRLFLNQRHRPPDARLRAGAQLHQGPPRHRHAHSIPCDVCGTPDQCYRQITDFIEHADGLGNLLVIAQARSLSHANTVDRLTLMAKEIMPRLKEYKQPERRRTRRRKAT